MTDNIFISYSKIWTQDLADKLASLIELLYVDKEVNVFFDRKDMTGGKLKSQLDKNIKQTNIGILLLTPENYSAEWLMFEAGALTQTVESIENGVIIPYLFCRKPNKIEHPIQDWMFTRYIYKGSEKQNRQQLITLFKYINDHLDESNQVSITDIETKISRLWGDKNENSSLKVFLNELAFNLTEAAASGLEDSSLNSIENDHISLSGMKTHSQLDFSLADNITPKCPRELEKAFSFKLEEIPDKFKKRNAQDLKYGATRIILNNTRFSTFVAFTDSKRIVFFDRKKASEDETNVLNDRYDVFGSVQFENKSLNLKIKSDAFLNAPIKEIREINGAAIEDNEQMSGENNTIFSRETAVMFGICVYMEAEHLNLAVEETNKNEIIIIDVSSAKNWESNKLTSKARLAVRYLSSQAD